METREQEQLRIDTGETLRNPLLAFIGRHYYAPPAPGQAPSVAWQADTEGHALWLPRLAKRLYLDVPSLQAALYDVTSHTASYRNTICERVVSGAVSMYSETARRVQSEYKRYCAVADWARLRTNRHVLVVGGVALYDAYSLEAMLGWFSRTGWKYRLMDARLATTYWDRRLYTTEEALRCWLHGRPQPSIPDLAAAVRAAGRARSLPPAIPVALTASWESPWVGFQGERYIWGRDAVRLYSISARTMRRARREGRLEAGIVYGSVLIPFESLQRFLKWWYAHDCTWRRTAADTRGEAR